MNGYDEDIPPYEVGVPHVIKPIIDDDDNENKKKDDDTAPIPGGGSIVFGDSSLGFNPDIVELPQNSPNSPPVAGDSPFTNPAVHTSCKDYHIETMAVISSDVYRL